ncbi:DUF692 domain-containing protein [Chitinivorax sp. B]|uniref:MNIO family bufferin maturase n=1 Tax=Chitinivorax sp. B TaxID=2502235 RepID=UPI0010F751B7|nr:DUF692 domain-containing protein [Chitinivorax sp. B]
MPPPVTALPVAAGIGLRMPHIREVIETQPTVAWWEVHAENFFGGGANLAALEVVRSHAPISLHGVGLGLGNAEPLRQTHLAEWTRLIDRIDPAAISEHLCWNAWQNDYFNDLLPLPYSEAALAHMVERVGQVQHVLGRRILIENLSSYVAFPEDVIPEGEFLAELVVRTGCGLLLDINNLYVNQRNLGRDAAEALAALPVDAIGEIHIAGFEARDDGLLIDTHGAPVCDKVWDLLAVAYQRFGPVPTLLERDTALPSLAELQREAARAEHMLTACRERLV